MATDYLNQYIQSAQAGNQPALNYNQMINRQAYDRDKLNMDQSRTNIQGDYTAGVNRLNELRGQTQADFAAGSNRLSEQLAGQLPQYTQQANQASAQGAMAARRLSELMAQKGLGRSGSFLTGQTNLMNQTRGQINDINTQRNLFQSGIANRQAELGMSQANAMAGIGNRQAELLGAYNRQLGNLDQTAALYGTQQGERERALAQQYAERMAAASAQAPLTAADLYLREQAQNANLQNQTFNQGITQRELDAQLQNQRFNQYLAGLTAGQNALTSIAGITGQFNQPTGYLPGDLAVYYQNLLRQGVA